MKSFNLLASNSF